MSESERYRQAKRAVEAIGEGLVRWALNEDPTETWETYRARAYDRVQELADGVLMAHEVRECLGREAFDLLKVEHKRRKVKR